jgi:hypothetical protein
VRYIRRAFGLRAHVPGVLGEWHVVAVREAPVMSAIGG